MLKFLVIKCNEENPDHIAELFFIDDIEVSIEISSIIKARILQTKYRKNIYPFFNIKNWKYKYGLTLNIFALLTSM